jgi:ubiquinone/menaquinone biosynthesis C-methylase UbiE
MGKDKHLKTYYEPARWYDLRDFSSLHDEQFFLKMAEKFGPRVLECAVGTGRLAIPLAQAGFEVCGIDRDPSMLAWAEKKWEAVRAEAKGSLRLVCADVTVFNPRKRFDMAFIAFNTFLTLASLEHREAALQCVRRSLTPNGRFIIDLYQPDINAYAGDQPESRDFVLMDPESGGVVERYSWTRRDMSTQQVHVSLEYRWTDPDGTSRRETTTFPMCVIFPVEMELLLRQNGFEVERICGDHDDSRFHKHSPRMIFIARKVPYRRTRRP